MMYPGMKVRISQAAGDEALPVFFSGTDCPCNQLFENSLVFVFWVAKVV